MTDARVRRIYFDANVYIELIEKNSATSRRLSRLFGGSDWQRHLVVTSEITLAEVLVKPFAEAVQTGDYRLSDLYQRVLSIEPGVTDIVPVTKAIWRHAALLRARLKYSAGLSIKLPDAVHIAAALEGRCDSFITNDGSLQSALRAIIDRRAGSEAAPWTALTRLVTFADAELDALADELQCP